MQNPLHLPSERGSSDLNRTKERDIEQNDEENQADDELSFTLQFALSDIEQQAQKTPRPLTISEHKPTVISDITKRSILNSEIELGPSEVSKKDKSFTEYINSRSRTSSTLSRMQYELKQRKCLGMLVFLCLFPFYCVAQLFISFRDQVMLIFWRNIVIDNSSLRFKSDYRQELIMKSKGFHFYRNKDLQYILYRVSRRYYILFFILFTIIVALVWDELYTPLDQYLEGLIDASVIVIIQLIVYAFLAYSNLLSRRKLRGDLYDYLSQYYPLDYVNLIDSDHTELKSIHEIKKDILTYGYVFLTTANQGSFILSVRDLSELDIHDLISERLLRNDQEIIFLKIKSPYNHLLLEKKRLLITLYKERWSFFKIRHREINADLLIIDMTIYNTLSILFLMLYYFTSFDVGPGYFFVIFIVLILLFGLLFVYRLRRFMNIQFRVVDHDTFHFLELYSLEKKGKQLEYNPWWKLQQKQFYQLFQETVLAGRISDVLLRCCQDLAYLPEEEGFAFHDFIKYIDHVSNINKIGLKVVTKDYLLYSNVENENLLKVISFDPATGKISLIEVSNSELRRKKIPTREEYNAFRELRVC